MIGVDLWQRRVWLTVLVAVVVVVALAAGFLFTTPGQEFDVTVSNERFLEPLWGRRVSTDALQAISLVTFALGLIALLVLGIARHRWQLGVLAAGAVLAAAVTAEAAKRLIPKPELVASPALLGAPDATHTNNSFPSGHAAISTGLALALLLVLPLAWRAWLAPLAAAFAGFQSGGVVVAGWHRPSDAVAGCLVALGWGCLALLVAVRLDQLDDGPPVPRLGVGPWLAFAVPALGFLAVMASAGQLWATGADVEFTLTIVVLVAVAVAVVTWFAGLLGQRVTARQGS